MLVNAKSQFDKGFDKDSNIVSAAFSPLTITSSVGLEYKKSGFSALFSFLTGKSTYVSMASLRGTNGYTDTPEDGKNVKLSKVLFNKEQNINLRHYLIHYADNYSSLPTLSDEWIAETDQNIERTLATTTQLNDQFIFDFQFNCEAVRPMPVYSVPGLYGHH